MKLTFLPGHLLMHIYMYRRGDSRYPLCLREIPLYCANMPDFCIVTYLQETGEMGSRPP